MKKQAVIHHYEETIQFVRSLEPMSEQYWRTPIAAGKWTIAEIVAHFIPWDAFVQSKRLPYFHSSEPLPPGPQAAQVNHEAADWARITPVSSIVNEFVEGRDKLIASIDSISEAYWQTPFQIGETELTIARYFENLAAHDRHHMVQITDLLDSMNETTSDSSI